MVLLEENNLQLDRTGLRAAVDPNVGFFRKPLSAAIESALIALTGDSNQDTQKLTQAEKQRSLMALQHTGAVIRELAPKNLGQMKLEVIHRMSFKVEGLFDVRLSWEDLRILNVGFLVDEQQNLIIANSQRHKLDELHRREASGHEKKRGDNLIRAIKDETGLSIETFGAIAAIFYLTKRMNLVLPNWSKKILFPDFEQRPEVQKIRRDSKMVKNQTEKLQKYFREEIAKKRQQIDFQTLLAQIGIDHFGENGRFINLSLPVLERSYEQNFTDDQAFPNRYKYRRILSALLN